MNILYFIYLFTTALIKLSKYRYYLHIFHQTVYE